MNNRRTNFNQNSVINTAGVEIARRSGRTLLLFAGFALTILAVHAADTATSPGKLPELSQVTSRADLEAVIAATPDASVKQALTEHADAILIAAQQHPHVVAVIRTIESAPGTFTKVNTTPEGLKKATGGEIAIFDTLTMINTGILNGHPHDSRDKKADPYDAAFIEHLGQIPSLENVSVVVTRLEDSWLDPLLKLKRLESLRIEKRLGNGLGDTALAKLRQLTEFPQLKSLSLHYFKATDAGLEHLAGLKNLESFSFRGHLAGHAFAKFEGWTNLKSIAFHGNGIDDQGLGYICEQFPNLESLNLIHARELTDASAVHLPKLKKLKNVKINGPKVTAAWLRTLEQLPIDSLLLGNGVNTPASEAITTLQSLPGLRRLNFNCQSISDADLALLASLTQLEELHFVDLDLDGDRLPQIQAFSFLNRITLALRPKGYAPETQAKIRALLPDVELKFVQ